MRCRRPFSTGLLISFAAIASSVAVAMSAPGVAMGSVTNVGLGYSPRVATDSDGDAIVAWEGDDAVQVRLISRLGTMGPVINVGVGGEDPEVAMGSTGDALVVWRYPESYVTTVLRARTVSRTGILGPVKSVAAGSTLISADSPRVAVDQYGDGVIAWDRYGSDGSDVVQARTMSRAGALGLTRTLSGDGATGVDVAMAATGAAVVVWGRATQTSMPVEARTISAGGQVGPLRTVATLGYSPRVGMDRVGNGVIVWHGPDFVQARQISAGGVLRTSRTIGASPYGYAPDVAVDNDNDATIVYEDGSYNVAARVVSRSGALGANRVLSPTVGNVKGDPKVAVDARNDSAAVWAYNTTTENQRIQTRALARTGGISVVYNISGIGSWDMGPADPVVAMDRAGDDMWTVWDNGDVGWQSTVQLTWWHWSWPGSQPAAQSVEPRRR